MDKWDGPLTFEEAVQEVIEDLLEAAIPKKETEIGLYHHGYGTALRNEWGLWVEGTPLRSHMKERFGLGHADDLSGLILGKALADYRGESFDIEAEVLHYKKHWQRYNVDPLTQKQLNQK